MTPEINIKITFDEGSPTVSFQPESAAGGGPSIEASSDEIAPPEMPDDVAEASAESIPPVPEDEDGATIGQSDGIPEGLEDDSPSLDDDYPPPEDTE